MEQEESTMNGAAPMDQPVKIIDQFSNDGARLCFFMDYFYMAYENGGNCWISRSPDGWHWQDTRQLGEKMDVGTTPGMVNYAGTLVVGWASGGTFVILGTEDGWRWELNEVLTGNNFNTKGGITLAFSGELYLFWVNSSSWKIWMIHTTGGISTWSDPITLTDPTAQSVNCAPTAGTFQNSVLLIYQNYGGVGATPVPHSPAPTALYIAQYMPNNTWKNGQQIPIVGNPANPCLITISDNKIVIVYTKRDTNDIYAIVSEDGVKWETEMTLVKGEVPAIGTFAFSPEPFVVFKDAEGQLWVVDFSTESRRS